MSLFDLFSIYQQILFLIFLKYRQIDESITIIGKKESVFSSWFFMICIRFYPLETNVCNASFFWIRSNSSGLIR